MRPDKVGDGMNAPASKETVAQLSHAVRRLSHKRFTGLNQDWLTAYKTGERDLLLLYPKRQILRHVLPRRQTFFPPGAYVIERVLRDRRDRGRMAHLVVTYRFVYVDLDSFRAHEGALVEQLTEQIDGTTGALQLSLAREGKLVEALRRVNEAARLRTGTAREFIELLRGLSPSDATTPGR